MTTQSDNNLPTAANESIRLVPTNDNEEERLRELFIEVQNLLDPDA
jgi:hypothetical protein